MEASRFSIEPEKKGTPAPISEERYNKLIGNFNQVRLSKISKQSLTRDTSIKKNLNLPKLGSNDSGDYSFLSA